MQQRKFSPEKYIRQNGRKLLIEKCLIADQYENQGLTVCLIVRKQSSKYFSFANILVDRLCLGIKNVMANCNFTKAEIDDFIDRLQSSGELKEVSPVYFHNLVYGAMDYATENGFNPHKDFDYAQYLLEPDLVDDGIDEIEFGWEGKPLYIQGPHDNGNRILGIINAKVGKGNYNFIVEEEAFQD